LGSKRIDIVANGCIILRRSVGAITSSSNSVPFNLCDFEFDAIWMPPLLIQTGRGERAKPKVP
jgi:hypothetical protein